MIAERIAALRRPRPHGAGRLYKAPRVDGSTLLRCGAELAAVCYRTGLGTDAAPKTAAFIVNWPKQPFWPVALINHHGSFRLGWMLIKMVHCINAYT